ncbi:MAG: PQ-loop domain-containing transporter [candidate division KSB1 bacterium]|nr:PQ-loop domain-containing transporter [candidate division KSB1 bacterium]MDZ7302225.1 PQ-loop domain-containing transporter [candidate division KSB1 bacterium]MDZ7311331.1 PQ-loop domain-containing transporter [candidate division KSB1 bacterium]
MNIKQIVAYLFGTGLMVNAALFVPQAVKIFKTKSARDVSRLTFAGFNVLQLIGILHGYLQGDPYLLSGMVASFLCCGAVTILALIYRNQ